MSPGDGEDAVTLRNTASVHPGPGRDHQGYILWGRTLFTGRPAFSTGWRGPEHQGRGSPAIDRIMEADMRSRASGSSGSRHSTLPHYRNTRNSTVGGLPEVSGPDFYAPGNDPASTMGRFRGNGVENAHARRIRDGGGTGRKGFCWTGERTRTTCGAVLRQAPEQSAVIAGPTLIRECVSLHHIMPRSENDPAVRPSSLPMPREIVSVLDEFVVGRRRRSGCWPCGVQPLPRVETRAAAAGATGDPEKQHPPWSDGFGKDVCPDGPNLKVPLRHRRTHHADEAGMS
jgi:hypothetical protein